MRDSDLKELVTVNEGNVAIIPCFNARPFCEAVVLEADQFVDHLVLVDDGSTDGTSEILQKMALHYPKIHLIKFLHNRGKGFALLEGIRYVINNLKFNIVITIDADGQHNPKDIPNIIKEVEKGADMVIGTREFSKMPFRSCIANTVILRFLRMVYTDAPYDTQSGFRAFGKEFLNSVNVHVEGGRYEMEFRCLLLAIQEKRKIVAYPIKTVYIEKNRYSQFSVIRDSYRILKVFWEHVTKRR